MFFNFAVLAYLMFIIYSANMVQRDAWQENVIRYMLYSVVFLIFLFGVFASQVMFLDMFSDNLNESTLPEINPIAAIATTLFAFTAAGFALRVVSTSDLRERVKATVLKETLYDPDSAVHTTAIVLSLLLVTALIVLFMLEGGTAAVAENLETSGLPVIEPIFMMVVWLFVSFLGVGYAIRRYLPDAIDRLGLTVPTARDVTIGAGVGVACWVASIVFAIIWQALTPPDVFEQQNLAAEQLTRAINSVFLVFLVSFTAALGEEIFIRGALQPVFGIWVSGIFFTLLHTQYLFAPSMLLIYGVSIVLGLLRQRMSTTTAIIAHFVYNFVPLLLTVLLASQLPVT